MTPPTVSSSGDQPPKSPQVLAVFAPGSLAGRRAVVTGGGSGIGQASALLLAEMGAEVVVIGRRAEALAETVSLGASSGSDSRIHAAAADIREPDQVEQAISTALELLGGIDILVNNAGGQFVSAAEDISPKGFRAVTRLNLDATWHITTEVARRAMLPQGYGKIISITMTPHRGMPGMSHSSAARAAVESLTRTWATEWGPRGVRAVAVAPGIVHTSAWGRYGLDPDVVSTAIPLRRLQTADEVASVVGFLASPAGDYITGTVITADGGFDVSPAGSAFGG